MAKRKSNRSNVYGGLLLFLLMVGGFAWFFVGMNGGEFVPLATVAPTDTPTRSPEDVARDAYREAMGRSRLDDLDRLIVNERIVTIRFALGSFPITTAETFYPQLVCELRGAGLTGRTYQITGTVNLVDNFGNVFEGEGVEMILYWDTISQINCGSPHNVNLPAIADRWDVHPALD